jgi:hypothetical protein
MTNFMMVLGCLSLYLIAGFIVLFISAKLACRLCQCAPEQEPRVYRKEDYHADVK